MTSVVTRDSSRDSSPSHRVESESESPKFESESESLRFESESESESLK